MDTKTTASHGKRTLRVEDDYAPARQRPLHVGCPAAGPDSRPASCARRTPAPTSSRSTPARRAAIKGVVAVLTGDDMQEAGHGNLSQHPPVAGRSGGKLVMPFRPALVA